MLYHKYMYYSITGNVIFFEEGRLVVETGGVGYDLCVSTSTLSKFGKQNEMVTVFTYFAISQDSVRLFGFYSKEEKSMFEKLISVGGVGPKVALQILSGLPIDRLACAIASNDIVALSKIKGIGKKTAERIVLELKEKIVISQEECLSFVGDFADNLDSVANDAILALVSLGIPKSQAYKSVCDARVKTDRLENIITLALRSMDR
ncbi:MAG: Holliday junction branch migration protein RuvA, partial [Clostridia bacterium]